ncbi:MAG TPA: asparagine synthase (glutamine-hydrolyzing) [Pyrinomonadaceae bacterium]
MCGISGMITRKEITPEERHRVSLMGRALVHRGPDGGGDFHGLHISLAARRLAIIDLAGGDQPLYNEDKSLVLIANGEIYNHLDLRAYFQGLGHQFRSGSDCETILHAYEEDGVDCVHYLRGMFAFALWDERRRRVVLGRDPMGEKPIYIYQQNERILFASEMKALLRSGLVPFELDPAAINNYFHYQYVPEPQTAIRGVRKLPAGHVLTIDIDAWAINESRYWSMEDAPPIEGDPATLIFQELDAAAELMGHADVPIGVALSGGLDSSTVAAFAAQHNKGELHAFSIGYEGRPEDCDERKDARNLADYLGLTFHEGEIKTDEVVEFFSELQFWKDDPIADYAGHAYYEVMKLARENNVPVVLQGQGGDELFWGYPQLRQAARETKEKQILSESILNGMPHYLSPKAPTDFAPGAVSMWARDLAGVRSGLRRMNSHRKSPASQMVFYNLSSDFRQAVLETSNLYGNTFSEELSDGDPTNLFTLPRPWPSVDVSLTRLISDTYLRGNGITQGDRLAMASSVEMRLPLLDRVLVKTIIGLRKAKSDAQLPPKEWLRRAVKNILPNWVIDRPKRGFAPPVDKWHAAIFAKHGQSLCDGYLENLGVLNRESAQRLAHGPFPQGLTSPISFKALVLEHWCRQMSAAVPGAIST